MPNSADTESLRAQMQEIGPYEFEEFVADLWEEEGWDTTVTRASNDEGVDVEAVQSGAIDQKLLIQAKRHSDGNKVGRPDVQRYHSLKTQDRDADAAAVVTTSEFTDQAKVWAYEQNVKLVDGDELAEMVQRHGRADLVEQYVTEEDVTESDTNSTSTTTSTSTDNQTADTDGARGKLWAVALVTAVQIGAVAFLAPPAPGSTAETLTVYAAFAAWLAAPIVIYEDLKALNWADGSRLGALVWILGALIYIVVPCWYIFRRTTE